MTTSKINPSTAWEGLNIPASRFERLRRNRPTNQNPGDRRHRPNEKALQLRSRPRRSQSPRATGTNREDHRLAAVARTRKAHPPGTDWWHELNKAVQLRRDWPTIGYNDRDATDPPKSPPLGSRGTNRTRPPKSKELWHEDLKSPPPRGRGKNPERAVRLRRNRPTEPKSLPSENGPVAGS